MKTYIERMRPTLAILENVPDLVQDVQLQDGSIINNLQFIVDDMEAMGMTAFTTVLDRADYGSSVDGRRLFIVIFDLQPDVGKKFERRFHSILEELRLPDRVPVHRSLLDEGNPLLSSQAREAMAVARDLPKWKDVHEAAFLGLSLTWPPATLEHDISGLRDFREREAEVVWAANRLFPGTPHEDGVTKKYGFFDANLTFERVFRWPPKPGSQLANPWQESVPCPSGNSVMVMRVLAPSGAVTIRRLHGVEIMGMQGWDISFWQGNEIERIARQGCKGSDFTARLAGNMWNMAHVIPVMIATLGSVPLEEALQEHEQHNMDDGDEGSAADETVSESD